MLNIRNFLRLCKHSSQRTIGRTSVYFSSSSDDSNDEGVPAKEQSDNDQLDKLLDASFVPSSVGVKIKAIDPKNKSQSKSQSVEKRSAQKPDAGAFISKSSGLSLDELLSIAHIHSKSDKPFKLSQPPENDSQMKTLGSSADKSPVVKVLDLPVKQDALKLSSKELLERVKKIAQHMAQGADDGSKKVIEELIENLKIKKEDDKPIDLNKIKYETVQTTDFSNQSLDLLRNRVVSEENIYNPAESPWEIKKNATGHSQDRRDRWSVGQHNFRNIDITLYPQKRLEIFTQKNIKNQSTETFLHTYDKLEKRELRLSTSYAPRNWFEQCIQWTEQGKLWQFPINNEQGFEEEAANVSFTEHIFLDGHLEGWCPTFGPVQHFMELVCIGLSKNHTLSVAEKVENINWYRDYFNKHRDILEASGTFAPAVTEVPHLEAQ